MSTTLLKESFNPLNIQHAKSFVMPIGRPKLAELVKNRVAELNNLSTNDVARRARAGGFELSNGTVWNIMNNRTQDIKEETLQAVAYALELAPDVVLAAYYDKPEPQVGAPIEFGVLFHGWEDASEEDRAATLEAIEMIAESFQRRRRRKPANNGNKRSSNKKG